jgi:MFS family permease
MVLVVSPEKHSDGSKRFSPVDRTPFGHCYIHLSFQGISYQKQGAHKYFGRRTRCMNRQQHGMLSLIFLSLSLAIALVSIGISSVLLAILYACVLGLSGTVVLYSFCARCMCRDTTCGHVIPGLLTRYLPRRKAGRYTSIDRFGIILPAVVSLAYPQYWLIGDLWAWGGFWILIIGAAVEIRSYVCPGCANRYCPVRQSPPVETEKESQERV